jgi:hypothetical protein
MQVRVQPTTELRMRRRAQLGHGGWGAPGGGGEVKTTENKIHWPRWSNKSAGSLHLHARLFILFFYKCWFRRYKLLLFCGLLMHSR